MSLSKNDLQTFINNLPDDRQDSFKQLYQTIVDNIPKGFAEVISVNMIAYQVPLA